jgi:hypothetical protein
MADGVIDVEALGTPDAGGEVTQPEESQQQSQDAQQAQRKADDKAYADYVKGLREDPNNPHSRRLKDDWGRLQALRQIDPKGIEGIRERYETLNGVAHGDKTGIDAVTSIQEALAESQTTLDAISQGDFSVLGEDQVDGVLRMAPSMLEHLSESNPDAYSALLLPHFVEGLKSSALYSSLNGLLGTLNEKPPSWLTKEQIPQWTLEHVGKVSEHAQKMAQWFQAQDDRVKQLGGKDNNAPRGTPAEKAQSGTTNAEFWEKSVHPQTNQHAEETFNKELRPWSEKLQKAGIRLSDAKKQALAQEMVRDISAAAKKNPAYTGQMKRFNSQRSPDSASVISTFKSEFNRHAKTVMEALIRRDYGQVLDKGGAKPTVKASQNGSKPAPVASGVKAVSVKPDRNSIDFQRTPTDWIYLNKYRLKDGSVVQYRP